MECIKCNKEHDGSFGSGKYCSRSCANSHIRTEESKKKTSIGVKTSEKFIKNNKLKNIRLNTLRYKKTKCKFCKCSFTYKFYNKQRVVCSKKECINKRISEVNKGKCGGYRIGSGRCYGEWYNSKIAGLVYCHSSYELAYAKYLDVNDILWVKNKKSFLYSDENNIERKYIPDFYLISDNKYVETKGYETIRDKYKWKQFPHKLDILKKKELKMLNIL